MSFNVYAEDINLVRCKQALQQGQFEQAVTFAEQVLSQHQEQADAWICKGQALDGAGEVQQAEQALLSAIKFAKLGFDRLMAHLIIGNFYNQQRKPDTALTHYQKSLQISQQENLQKFTRISYHLSAEAYTNQQDYQAALAHYQQGSALDNNDNERADSYERLSNTYQSLKEMDKAIEYQLKASLMQKKAGTLDQYAEATLRLGQLFSLNNEYANAERTLNRFLQFAQDNGGVYYEARAQYLLAQNKQVQGDKAAANHLLEQAKVIATRIQAPDLIADIEKLQVMLAP